MLVVSPLIAIMKDQVASLTQKGITAMHIVEEMKEETVEAVHEWRFQVLFFSYITNRRSVERYAADAYLHSECRRLCFA